MKEAYGFRGPTGQLSAAQVIQVTASMPSGSTTRSETSAGERAIGGETVAGGDHAKGQHDGSALSEPVAPT